MGVSIKKNYYHSESCAFDFKRLLNLVNLKHKKIHEALCRLMMGIHNQTTAEKKINYNNINLHGFRITQRFVDTHRIILNYRTAPISALS